MSKEQGTKIRFYSRYYLIHGKKLGKCFHAKNLGKLVSFGTPRSEVGTRISELWLFCKIQQLPWAPPVLEPTAQESKTRCLLVFVRGNHLMAWKVNQEAGWHLTPLSLCVVIHHRVTTELYFKITMIFSASHLLHLYLNKDRHILARRKDI